MYLFLYIILLIKCNTYNNENKIIISLSSNGKEIQNTNKIINSILEQNIDNDLYEILLILSLKDFKNIQELQNNIQSLESMKKIKIIFIKEDINNQSKLLIAMKEYKNNPILIINNKCLLPNGWLEMFIEDHIKYPNDALVANIQYIFGKNGEIKELTEGFKGEKFGTFNHVTDMIFNFALVNIDLGGILYPKNFFNDSLFFDQELFMKIAENSDEFWQSAFIIMEDKILRQTSKIFDYTKYIIEDNNNTDNYVENCKNKKVFFEKIKLSFIKQFPNFNYYLEKRQNKIIVSITSFPKRFPYLPGLNDLLKDQTFHINKAILYLYKEDYKNDYHLNLSDFEIILTDEDLRPHKKYFYCMQRFREYAIITLDDDFGYEKRTLESFHDAYIENPNVVSGRRSHRMTYKKNGELKGYYEWESEQKSILEPNFDLFFTGCGGIIYPPDILNINDDLMPIINETIVGDDFTLKYLEIKKGIPEKWISSNYINGISRILPRINAPMLESVNKNNNNIYISKLNLLIQKTNLNQICAPYRDLHTGLTIYLFDIHNKHIIDNKLYFDINAYSYCPIDTKLKFDINFDNYVANCIFNESSILWNQAYGKTKYTEIAKCKMDEFKENLDYYYFPKAITKENIHINIYHYQRCLTNIFKSFICNETNYCFLKLISFSKINNNFPLLIYDKTYVCNSNNNYNNSDNEFPIIQIFRCILSNYPSNISRTLISGIPLNNNLNIIDTDIIPNQFIISRIVVDIDDFNKQIILIGKVSQNLEDDYYNNLQIKFLSPNIVLECYLKSYSKYVQSKIYCNNTISNIDFNSEILIENQICFSKYSNKELLLISEETFINIKVNNISFDTSFNSKNYENIGKNTILSIVLIIIFILELLIKLFINK